MQSALLVDYVIININSANTILFVCVYVFVCVLYFEYDFA